MKSCVMSTIYAPAYANIFMGKVENYIFTPTLRNFSPFYCRFVEIFSYEMEQNLN